MKRKTREILLLISALTMSAAAAMGFSYAAYIYNNLYNNLVDFNTGKFTDHFDGGTGEETSPYLIANSEQLRNLQKLNVLGVFNRYTYFKLTNDITWTAEEQPLYPIGTEDNPFDSIFQGNGKKITNLVVEGSQTNDIGMFGYAGINSEIRNFILKAPLIKVTNAYNTALRTTNPLAPLFQGTSAGGVIRNAADLSLTIAGDRKSFTINTDEIVDSYGNTHTIVFEISNPEYLTQNGSNNKLFNVVNVNGDENRFYRTQLAAKVFALHGNELISYTLERWHINVNYNGTVNIANGDVKVGYWRTIHANANEGFGPHLTYVGFFVGHLDGIGSYLGLDGGTATNVNNNAKLHVEGREARSYNVLIGRSYEDNDNDDANGIFRRENLNFTELPQVNKEFTGLPGTPANNQGQMQSAINNTRTIANNASYDLQLVDSAFKPDYIRYWPGTPNSKILAAHEYYDMDEEGNLDTQTTTSTALQINGPIEGYTYQSSLFGLVTTANGIAFRNTITFHLTSESVGQSFFRKSRDYLAELKFRYTVTGDVSNLNRVQVLYNMASVAQTSIGNRYMTNMATIGSAEFDPNDYPLHQDTSYSGSYPRIYEHTVKFQITASQFSIFGNVERHLMFGFGVGKQGTYADQTLAETGSFTVYRYSRSGFQTDPFSLQILGADVLFSSLDGNVNPQAYKVDFIYNADANNLTFNPNSGEHGTWSNWNSTSNIKIRFNGDSVLNNTGNNARYRFFRRNVTTPSVYIYQTVPNSNWTAGNAPDHSGATNQGAY